MTKRTQADRDEDLALGRELERKDAERDRLLRIIYGLFNPMPDDHAKGCLSRDPHIKPRGPCQCGYASVAGEYLWALREAKKIAAAHFGEKEVENSVRLREPPELVAAVANEQSATDPKGG